MPLAFNLTKIGDVFKKKGVESIIVTNDKYPLQSEKILTVRGLKHKSRVTTCPPKSLYILGYRFVKNRKDLLETGDGEKTKWCSGSNRLASTCRITKGILPDARDKKIRLKGRRVDGVRALCRECARSVNVVFSRGELLLARHKYKTPEFRRTK